MNKTRRVFSLLLAVVLVLSVFGVTASASVASGKAVGISAEAVGTPVAGGTIDVKYYFEFPETVDLSTFRTGLWQFVISYNSKYITPVSRTFNSTEYDFLDVTVSYDGTKDTFDKISKVTSSEDAALYPNSTTVGPGTWNTSNSAGYTTASGVSYGNTYKAHVFTVTWKIADDWDGTEFKFGILDSSFGTATTTHNINYFRAVTDKSNTALNKSGKYYITAIDNQSFVTIKAASYKVTDEKIQIRRNAADSSKYDLGFVGSFKTADIEALFETNSNKSTNILEVGCIVTMNGSEGTYTDGYIYPTDDGDGWKFRAILTGLEDSMADTEISVQMFVKVQEGTKTETYKSKGVTTKLSAHTGRLPA